MESSTSVEPSVVESGASTSWLSRLGIALVGTVAGRMALAPKSARADGICNYFGCCCLKHPAGGCPGSGSTHTCPSGYTKRSWVCCDSGINRQRWCSECTKGATCWDGPWACSETYTSPVNCT